MHPAQSPRCRMSRGGCAEAHRNAACLLRLKQGCFEDEQALLLLISWTGGGSSRLQSGLGAPAWLESRRMLRTPSRALSVSYLVILACFVASATEPRRSSILSCFSPRLDPAWFTSAAASMAFLRTVLMSLINLRARFAFASGSS